MTNVYYIPLGRNCLTSGNLKEMKLRNCALPFDWILMKPSLKGFSCINQLIESNFNNFTDNLEYNDGKKVFSRNYPNLLFFHHDLIKYEEYKNKFNNRAARFMDIINNTENKCKFVYNISKLNYDNVEEMKEFKKDIYIFLQIMKNKCAVVLNIIVDHTNDFELTLYEFLNDLQNVNVYFHKFIIDHKIHNIYGDCKKYIELIK
jgi:hypothetical protein